MRKLVPILSFTTAFLSTAVVARSIDAVPPRGAPLSWVYDIASVHEASTARDVVRVIHWYHAEPLGAGTILHVISDPRAPASAGRPMLQVWEIGNFLREVRGVRINDDVISVLGIDNASKPVNCGYRLKFTQGLLANSVDELGCKPA